MTGFTAIPGHGVEARVDGRQVIFGNLKLMTERQVSLGDIGESATVVTNVNRFHYFTLKGAET